jgi:enamine deaminase RidA (YjgF/YER057c/UK114 family)
MKFNILVLLCILSISSFAQITKEKWHWGQALKQDTTAGYAQVVKVGNVLYISGAVARDITPDGITRVYKALEQSSRESRG